MGEATDVDGLDGAGKTVLAEEIVQLAAQDGFHRPRSVRYATGRGLQSFCRGSYDCTAISSAELDLVQDCVLLVDGIFPHRPELHELWDASIWVQVPFAVSGPHGNERLPGKYDPGPGASTTRI